MFSWRSRRQLVISAIVITPFVIAALFIIRYAIPEPTCFDEKQNQQETGVDCGGGCISCQLKYPQPIKVFWARAAPVRENSYDVAAEVQNPNEYLSSADVKYEFSLYDDFGPVTTRIGKTFLYAQERALIIQPNIETMRSITRTEFRITHVTWQEKRDLSPTIVTERRDYRMVENGNQKQSIVDITLFNASSYDFAKVEIHVAALDSDQNLLGVNMIEIENMLSQSRRTIQSIWPQAFTRDVAVINVQPRVNIFDPHSMLKPQ